MQLMVYMVSLADDGVGQFRFEEIYVLSVNV